MHSDRHDEESDARRIVFVCAHGAAKSVLAASYFNLVAARRGLGIRAIARGTEPDAAIAERVAEDLVAMGATVCVDEPEQLSEDDLARARLVVAFDQPQVAARAGTHSAVIAWDALPSLSQQFEQGRAAIIARTDALVSELAGLGDATTA